MEWERESLLISNDKNLLDVQAVHRMLAAAYWAKGRTYEQVSNSIEHSICFGVYDNKKQIGFARAVSDLTVFTWIADVIISNEYRGQGLGKWLVQCIISHPDLKNTRFTLATLDAHELYRKFGFTEEKLMRTPLNN